MLAAGRSTRQVTFTAAGSGRRDPGSRIFCTPAKEADTMIIDCHTHIFPAAVRQTREKFFPGEPAFELLYASPKARLVGARELVAAMDAQGVDRSIVFGFPWRDAQTARLNNDYVLDAVGRYPHRLVGLCCLDPFSPQAEAETRRCLDGGLSGIGELAFYQSGIDAAALDKLAPLMALCLAKGLIALIHTNEPVGHFYPGKTPNTLRQIYDLVRRFPENKIVLAHWGGGIFFYHLLKKEVKASLRNVYFDTAASPYLYDPDVYRVACEIIGAEKILFGSDYPLLSPTRYFAEMTAAGLSQTARDGICGENAARLLNL